MMKKRVIFFILVSILVSCKMNITSTQKQKDKFNINQVVIENEFEPSHDIDYGYSIVKTIENFSSENFTLCGGVVHDTVNLNDGYIYWLIKTDDSYGRQFRYNILTIGGTIYAQPDYKISLPKVKESNKVSNSQNFTMGVNTGALDGTDPAGALYEYSLKITKAVNWYDTNNEEKDGAYKTYGYGNNQVVLAIIDTGINMAHKDFQNQDKSIVLYAKSAFGEKHYNQIGDYQMLDEKDGFRELDIGTNEDNLEHGTHCSGIMCAVGQNGVGICGVSWKNTQLISYKSLGRRSGSIWSIYGALADLTKIVTILKKDPNDRTEEEKKSLPKSVPSNYKITQRTVPVNMSLGGDIIDPFANEILNKAIAADILPVVAIGNEGRTISAYPAGISGVLSVGSTTNQDLKSSFSDSGNWINICAPGENIISTWYDYWNSRNPLGVKYMSGTSMATPFVTGTLGYLLSFDNAHNLSPYQLMRVLELSADKIDSNNKFYGYDANGFSEYYGYGRVNVLTSTNNIIDVNNIPQEGSFYNEKPITFQVNNEYKNVETGLSGIKVYIYEKPSNLCVAAGITNEEGTVSFYGLKLGKSYIAKINNGVVETKDFNITDNTEQVFTIKYHEPVIFISTCPNEHYASNPNEPYKKVGLEAPFLKVYLFDNDGNPLASSSGFYPKLMYVATEDTEYYAMVCSSQFRGRYQGGNYGLYIGKQIKEAINKEDPRTNMNDSYEINNEFADADTKYNDSTPSNIYWERKIAATLTDDGGYSGYTNKGDLDFYKFSVPSQ